MSKRKSGLIILSLISILSLYLAIRIGSAKISGGQVFSILKSFLFKTPLDEGIKPLYYGMITGIRLPRVLSAFIAGSALAISGTIMQSVLKNPLASSYGLGVSSGAGLGAALVITSQISIGFLSTLLLPVVGTVFGLVSVIIAITIAQRLDGSLSNNTIILAGMVLSLFLNALMTTIAAVNPDYTHMLLLWQLGTFSSIEWSSILIMFVVLIGSLMFFMLHTRELDIMTFGEENSLSVGIDMKKEKWILITTSSFLTASIVSYVGIIGFVDLVTPHIVRKFFGSAHRWVLPMSALLGGAFMVVCDLISRTLFSPSEIPVGSITALIGTPFFIYIYLISRRK